MMNPVMKPVMRIETVKQNQRKLVKDFDLNKPEHLAQAQLSVLTDISETLAMYFDLMCSIYGRAFAMNDDNEGGKDNG